MSTVFSKFSLAVMITCVLGVSGCGGDQAENAETLTQNIDTVNMSIRGDHGYHAWSQNVLQSGQVINGSKSTIETSYDSIRNFNRQDVTASWIDDVASIMAKNTEYRQAIKDYSEQYFDGNNLKLAQSLLEKPQQTIRYRAAADALIDGLRHVEKFDYKHRSLSVAFEDAARGRSHKTPVSHKEISAIIPDLYASEGNTPSVAEQMLTAAAIKILNLTDHPQIKTGYNTILYNTPIESCLANAQRNIDQCKAASYDKNDLSFCMAKHAIGETTQCFSWILP